MFIYTESVCVEFCVGFEASLHIHTHTHTHTQSVASSPGLLTLCPTFISSSPSPPPPPQPSPLSPASQPLTPQALSLSLFQCYSSMQKVVPAHCLVPSHTHKVERVQQTVAQRHREQGQALPGPGSMLRQKTSRGRKEPTSVCETRPWCHVLPAHQNSHGHPQTSHVQASALPPVQGTLKTAEPEASRVHQV